MPNPSNKIHYTIGQQIGACVYLGDAYTKNEKRYANFECVCGNRFIAFISKVKNGHTKSCGCLLAKKNAERLTTHGQSKSKEYFAWDNMKQRCTNPKNNRYADWGGKGVTVCERWLHSFENFLEDMGNAPSAKHTVDRLDNAKGYSKENCAWKTQKEQSNNRRSNINIEYHGEIKTMKEWCELLELDYGKVVQRIRKLKWSAERAFKN